MGCPPLSPRVNTPPKIDKIQTFVIIFMQKVEIRKGQYWFEMELLSSTELLMRIRNDDQKKTALFQQIISFDAVDAQVKFLFQNIKELYEALYALVTRDSKQDFLIESNGKLHFLLDIKLYEKVVKKRFSFQLQKRLKNQEEVYVLRTSLNKARSEIRQLRQGITKLQEQNIEIKAKFSELEQLVKNKLSRRSFQQEQKPLSNKQTVQHFKNTNNQQNLKKKLQGQIQQQQISEQSIKIVPLNVQIDQKCLHYDKYKITDTKITSIYEDYYQINCKDPLPKKGIYSLKVKMAAQNHLSIGIIAKSALNNQYSFQNNKTICFYSYFYGNFRGIYFRSKYEPLSWSIQVGEEIDFVIDMNSKLLKIGAKNRKSTEIVNFTSLSDEQPVYFFIEMYEKDNSIQFIQ